jgi:hypothetical protein
MTPLQAKRVLLQTGSPSPSRNFKERTYLGSRGRRTWHAGASQSGSPRRRVFGSHGHRPSSPFINQSADPGKQRDVAELRSLDAGVKRYFPWQFGVDYDVIGGGSAQDLFDEQLDVRDLLRSQDRTEWLRR